MLSAHANSSSEIPKEVLQATQRSVPIITFRIEDVTPAGPLSYELNTIHWMDALTKPVERHIDRLAETLQRLLGDVPLPSSTVIPVPSPSAPARNRSSGGLAAGAVGVAVVAAVVWWVGRGAEAPRQSASPTPSPPPTTSTVLPQQSSLPPVRSREALAPTPPHPEPRPPSSGSTTQKGTASATHSDLGEAGQRNAVASSMVREDTPQRNAGASQTSRGDPGQGSASATQTGHEDAGQSNAGVKEQQPSGSVRAVACWGPPGSAGSINIHPDGSFVSGGVLTGSWTTINAATSTYVLQFPDDVGFGELSADGRRLVHSGNINTTLVRTAGGTDLPGTWQFSNGQPITFAADGTFALGAISGRWKLTDRAKRTYSLTWPGAHPVFTVAPDGQSARYSDSRYGVNVTLQRVACTP